MKKTSVFVALAAVLAAGCSKAYSGKEMYAPDASYEMADGNMPPEGDPSGDQFDTVTENPFVKVADEPASSFSVDADGASYAYMRRMVRQGWPVNPNSVRIEEYLNYFTFSYPQPKGEESLGLYAYLGPCPWNDAHLLLRLGLQGKSIPENQIPAANYILLIDTSGSMLGDDRIELIKTGVCTMVDYMRPQDRIAIITYSGSVKKVLESTLVGEGAEQIKKAVKSLNASGSTAGGAAMKMAYEEAAEHYVTGGNNRIIMCTDGDFNVGVSSTKELVEMVESYQDKGIYLSIMGFGTGNYMDGRMENLSNHGNGTYTYIDSEEEMMKVFVTERSHFYAVANDTKCQVRFNPAQVDSYRLIGYENRVMSAEEFEDSKKDAGEIGAGQTVTALYEIVLADGVSFNDPALEGFPATFEVRYKLSLKDTESRSLTMNVEPGTMVDINYYLSTGIAAYGLVLRNSDYKGTATLDMARDLVSHSYSEVDDPQGFRKQLVELIGRASTLE